METREAQELIISTLYQNNLVEKKLAEYLNLTPQALHYSLHTASNMNMEFYNKIKKYFRKENIIIKEPAEKIMALNNYTIEVNALIGHGLQLFNKILQDAAGKGKMDDKAKAELVMQLEGMEKDLIEKIGEIKEAVNS